MISRPRIQLPLPIYYLLIAACTEFALVSGAIIILLPTRILGQIPLVIFGILLLYKAMISTIVLISVAHNRWGEKNNIIKGGGSVLGRVVGLLLGGVLGFWYGGVFWAIAGSVGLYLLVGWIGSRISLFISNQLDKLTFSTGKTDPDSTLRLARPNTWLLLMYGMVVPVLVIVIAIFMKSYGIPGNEKTAGLPIARIAVIAVSLFSFLAPWFLRTRWVVKPDTSTVSRENAIFFLSLGLSVLPAIYGFFLFIIFGASIVEVSSFAVASSLAALFWSTHTKIRRDTTVG